MTSVVVPDANDTSITTIRKFFNAYLMHKLYVEHLVELGVVNLTEKQWLPLSTAFNAYSNLTKLLTILQYNVKYLARLVSAIAYCVELVTCNTLLYS